MTEDQIDRFLRDYDPSPNPGKLEFEIETDKICFLISKDQKVLLPEPWYFPYAGQWNAYNPFQKIKQIEIKDLGELLDLKVELELSDYE